MNSLLINKEFRLLRASPVLSKNGIINLLFFFKLRYMLLNLTQKIECAYNTKVLVFALHPHIQKSSDIYSILHNEILKAGIVGKKSSLKDFHWTDVFLPTLYDKDLDHIQHEFSPCISFLKTENFARGIGYQAKKWSSKIKV